MELDPIDTILLRELLGLGNEAYLCSVSHGASLVVTETETEGLDKDVFEYNKLTKYLSSRILLEANLACDKHWARLWAGPRAITVEIFLLQLGALFSSSIIKVLA